MTHALDEHDVEIVAQCAMRVAGWIGGRIATAGPPKQVLADLEVRRDALASCGMLVCQNVSWDIAGTSVPRGLSLVVGAGSTVAVVGSNGAGRTTLLRATMGLLQARPGRILFDGCWLERGALSRQPSGQPPAMS